MQLTRQGDVLVGTHDLAHLAEGLFALLVYDAQSVGLARNVREDEQGRVVRNGDIHGVNPAGYQLAGVSAARGDQHGDADDMVVFCLAVADGETDGAVLATRLAALKRHSAARAGARTTGVLDGCLVVVAHGHGTTARRERPRGAERVALHLSQRVAGGRRLFRRRLATAARDQQACCYDDCRCCHFLHRASRHKKRRLFDGLF